MPEIPYLDKIEWYGAVGSIVKYLFYFLIIAIATAAGWFMVHLMSFKYRVTVFPLYGSGKDGVFSVSKPKTNRVKFINKRTSWKRLWPLFNSKEVEPFDQEFIYPGKNVFALEHNDEWIPCRINIHEFNEKEIRATISPVPYYVRNWQSLAHKKINQELMTPGFWEANKQFFMVMGTVLVCGVMMVASIYVIYKLAGGGMEKMNNLSDAIRGFATQIQGKAPPG